MSTRQIPDENTPEAEALIKEYQSCKSREELRKLTQKYNYKNEASFMSSMIRRLHTKAPKILEHRDYSKAVPDLPPIVNLPEVKLREYKPIDTGKGDPEEQVLVLSDGHAGKITPTFNDDIYKKRMEILTERVMLIASLHRNMYPINKLHIICLGDNVQGENPYQGSKLGDTSMGARDQITKLALPAIINLILSLKQQYEEIEFDGFLGNHGRYGKEAPETSNWDIMLYDCLKASLSMTPNIKINLHTEFGNIIKIEGSKFFCFHGDEIAVSNGIPLFALTRRIDKWYQQFDGFDYAICGHFHKYLNDETSSKVELFMNGTLVSDDSWALKKIGISSMPSQWTFGVHKRNGVTWRYPLFVDRAIKI